MFLCPKCQELYNYSGLQHSNGPCEECGKSAICLDARHYQYKGPPREQKELKDGSSN